MVFLVMPAASIGHRWSFHQVELQQPDLTGKTLVTTRQLLHAAGHDLGE